MRIRHQFVKLASVLPFPVLTALTRRLPIWQDDDWSLWIDAHYLRWRRYDMALWGWRPCD